MKAPPASLPRIPTPSRHRWRHFCTEKLPALIFILGAAGVILLWRPAGAAPTLVAEAERVQSDIKAMRAGVVTDLKVKLFQAVAAGEVIALLHTTPPDVLAASLAVIRAEIELLRANLEPELGTRRVSLQAARLQLDWMKERVVLASMGAQLQQAETELGRLTPLHDKGLVADDVFDTARLLRERLTLEGIEQRRLVERIAPSVQAAAPETDEAPDPLAAALRVQEEKLRLAEAQLAPVKLTAPFAGLVTSVLTGPSATVASGDLVAAISAEKSERLVGYLRQPLPRDTRAGTKVELRLRQATDQRAESVVAEVGRVLEPVSPNVLALYNRAHIPELGLRVHIAIPPGFAVRPGEWVEVRMR